MSRKKERLYICWCHMKSRCYNKNNKDYKYYGEKGISLCDEWINNYENFKEWSLLNGYKPNLEIDRIDGNKNYCPENCRWTTRTEQMNNVSFNHLLTFNDESKTMAEWAKDKNLSYSTIKQRINKLGWSVEDALNTPQRTFGKKTNSYGEGVYLEGKTFFLEYNGKKLKASEWCNLLGLGKSCLVRRINKGWSASKCIETPRRENK